jgi:beta-glucanase (GH16 family)
MERIRRLRLFPRGGLAGRVALVAVLVGTLAALAVAWPLGHGGPAAATAGWHRVFFDDFTGGLRPSKWGTYSGQPGGDPGGWWAPSHVVVRNGILNLETYRDPKFGGRWVSGGVSSANALRQTYGRYEVRLRMDPGKGVAAVALLWPSGNQWPPEIDFAEDGGETNARSHISATLHYGADDKQIQRTVQADFTRWHTVGVEWTPGRLSYTLDGRRWGGVRHRQVPAQAMEMDLQSQAGTCGDASAPCPDATTPARVTFQIDWVAAYARR